MDLLCRVCLKKHDHFDDLISLLSIDENNREFRVKIMECTTISISNEDNLPSRICPKCATNLNVAHSFKTLCENSDHRLKSYLVTRSSFSEIPEDVYSYFLMVKPEPKNDEIISDTFTSDYIKTEFEENSNSMISSDDNHCDQETPVIIYNKYELNTMNKKENLESCKIDIKERSYSDDKIQNCFVKLIKQNREVPEKNVIRKKRIGLKKRLVKKICKSIDTTKDKLNQPVVEIAKCNKNLECTSEKKKKKETHPKVRGRPKKIYYDANGCRLPNKPNPSANVCDQCGKSFSTIKSLREHHRRHTGEKPFMCSNCGKLFHSLGDLRKHSRVHTGVKPYKCKYCERDFGDWGSRFKHERCHRGEKPYKCDLCPQKFGYSYVLTRHKLTHSGTKNFKCSPCSKYFTQKYHLDRHNKKYHMDEISNSKESIKMLTVM